MSVLVRAHLREGRAVRASIRRLPGHEYNAGPLMRGSGTIISRTGPRPRTLMLKREASSVTSRGGGSLKIASTTRMSWFEARGWSSPYVGDATKRRFRAVTPSSVGRIRRLARGLR